MIYTFKLEPRVQAYPLRTMSRDDAENRLKTVLKLQSRVPGKKPPDAVVLLEDGSEVWRWTQADMLKNEFVRQEED